MSKKVSLLEYLWSIVAIKVIGFQRAFPYTIKEALVTNMPICVLKDR